MNGHINGHINGQSNSSAIQPFCSESENPDQSTTAHMFMYPETAVYVCKAKIAAYLGIDPKQTLEKP